MGFEEFFWHLHGHEPFPWQAMLAERVLAAGWPAAIDLPTAAGKTAAIDVAVFALATDQSRPRQPRRIFFVIDRRIVVDEAFSRAERIAARLEAAAGVSDDPLHRTALSLLALGGDRPLDVAVMRGGLYRDHSWARSPAQPLVCVSTVDQIGSRLLFRGYGLQARDGNQLPIHAGLVGNDALVILDEAHLSAPFEETLDAVSRYRAWSSDGHGQPWHVVRMSATLATSDSAFPDTTERGRALAHPLLESRFDAKKLTELLPPTSSAFGAALATEARRLADEQPDARVIAVVTNRVASAREAYEHLARDGDCILLTGRSRSVDRQRILDQWRPVMFAGRKRGDDQPRLFVVATQCIEVGADLDFDVLVTEVAPLDSLRQRFGRLDRLGDRGVSRAAILVRKESLAPKSTDPVYGGSLPATWRWLQQIAARRGGDDLDFGVRATEALLPEAHDLVALLAPRASAPVLLPAHLDRLAQTSPLPAADPEVGVFLHGPDSGHPDVQVVWRADLGHNEHAWAGVAALVPPLSAEVIQLPVSVVRRWLAGTHATAENLADVTGDAGEVDDVRPEDLRTRVLRWRGPMDGGTIPVDPSEIRPGDTIVVPATVGGADAFGWSPLSTSPVEDVAEEALIAGRRRLALRLHPAVIGPRLPAADFDHVERAVREVVEAIDVGDDPRPVLESLLDRVAQEADRESVRAIAARLLDDIRHRGSELGRRWVRYPDGSGIVLVAPRLRSSETDGLTDEGLSSSLTRSVTLREHTDGVTARVRAFADACRLPEAISADLALAAQLHDLGKVDERFQLILHRGDKPETRTAAEPLAKSGLSPRDRTAFYRARALSGYPSGYRHEGASVALAASAPALLERASDPALVLHLVASHHGHARPFLPPVLDSDPVPLMTTCDGLRLETSSAHALGRLDSGVVDRFFDCLRRYGWWGLAFLEAVMRLADQRQSEAETMRS